MVANSISVVTVCWRDQVESIQLGQANPLDYNAQ